MTDKLERRRWPRLPLQANVEFRRKREMPYRINMHDLTPYGCRIGSPERLNRGEMVWVQLPTLESLPATVKWGGLGISGVEFERPMHVAVFDMMTDRLAPVAA
jgi:hypothetical protein